MSNFKKRLITSIVLVAVFVPLVILDDGIVKVLFLVLSLALSYGAGYELMKMYGTSSPLCARLKHVFPLAPMALAALSIYAVYKNFSTLSLVSLLAALLAFLMLSSILTLFVKDATGEDAARLALVLLYAGLALGSAMSLRFLAPEALGGRVVLSFSGRWCFLYAIATSVVSDAGAYVFGSLFGKKKLCPAISPHKTVAGAVGGMASAMVAGTAILFLTRIISFTSASAVTIAVTVLIALLLTALLSIVSMIGDLFASRLKRAYDIKDYGTIFPGHGGVLDRFDSYTFIGCATLVVIVLASALLGGFA